SLDGTTPSPTLVECERNRIARELHDHAGQVITTCIIRLDLLIKQHQSGQPGATDELRSLRALLDTYTHEIRQIAYDLRSHLLDSFKTVESYAREVGQNAGIEVDISIAPDLPKLPEEIEIAAFHAFQEAITNVVRHANAHGVSLQVLFDCDSGFVTLILEDDGQGFHPQCAERYVIERPHLGIIGMRERIEEVGGQLLIESAPARGTRVTIAVPRTLPVARKRIRRAS
ncbi:MAG TPA: sensor histidine kinase, partial [Chloroflexota bacterium]|nr:sensor histidine kinase [Chloroflexota bacterium]